MKNLTLKNIAAATGGKLICKSSPEDFEVAGIVIDSRKASEGFLFVATKGERVDGHSFIGNVAKAGAAAVVCEREPEENISYILVEDSFKALRDIAAFYRRQLSAKFVGITGSVGKTSTKEVIASVLSKKFKTCKTQGNFNNEVGVPLTMFSVKEDDEIAVLEMGINHFGEMHRLGEIVMPDVCVYTNIGQCHLEFLGSRDGILKAKTEMFDHLNEGAIAILNGDDDKLITVQEVQGKAPVFFGTGDNNLYRAVNVKPDGIFGSNFIAKTPNGNIETFMPLPGEHMVMNALAATAVGQYFGMSNEEISEGIKEVQSVSGRSNIIRMDNWTVIDDCYNANPVSMKAAVSLLAMANGRRVAILGDMFELGENERALHASVGTALENTDIEVLICVGDLSSEIIQACGDREKYWFSSLDEFMKEINKLIKKGDTILVKASHGMQFTKIVDYLSNPNL